MNMITQIFRFWALQVASCGTTFALLTTTLAQPMSAEPIKQIAQKTTSNSHVDEHIASLIQKADALKSRGKYDEAILIWESIYSITLKAHGPDHLDVATSLNNLAKLLGDQGQYAAAEPLYRRSLAIDEKVLGPDHPAVATTLNNLAGLLHEQGQYTAAEPLYRRSLAIRERALGPEHPDVANSLNNLAELLSDQGQYNAAEPLYRRSLAINEKALGPDHPDVAMSLNNLAGLLSDQGQHTAAEPLYRRSLAIREKVLGPDHPDVAISLNGLAALLRDQGQYAAAEPILRRSLAINEKALGPDHPDVANSLNNLAALLRDQGQYAAAEPLYRRSLAIREKVLGPHHPDVANSLNNLAALLSDQGQYAAAEPIYRRSLAINEKALGPDHPGVARSLNNLAGLLVHQRQAAFAEPLYRRSLAISEKALSPDHLAVAHILNNLASLLGNQRQYSAAELFYRRSLAIREKALGPDHPDVATSLKNMALLFSDQGQYDNAVSALKRSLTIESSWLTRELPLLPDQSRFAQLRQLGSANQYPVGLIARHDSAAPLAMETRLNRHGLLQEIEQRQALVASTWGSVEGRVTQLRALTTKLSSVSIRPERRTALRDERDRLQAEVYRTLPELQIQQVSAAEVAKALPAESALIEFQRFRPFNGRKPDNQLWGVPQYLALILKPDGSIQPVQLGPADPIDAAVQKGLAASAQNQSDSKAIWGQLSNLVLRPLLPHLNGSRQWFLSPDGELNRVPFAALPSPQQSDVSLAEAVQLRQLTTGRDLLRLKQPAAKGQAPVVFANPDYGRTTQIALKTTTTTQEPIAQQRSSDLGAKAWSSLPATALEGQRVATMLAAPLVSGSDASATRLEQLQSPRILHVATHGFFLADAVSKPQDPLRLIQDQAPQLKGLRQEDPQLRSGLVLAGANQPDANPNDDGYLTAAEAVTLNLKGTELVVLSACSTGQGDIRTGEGVYGLQRSLAVAGARSTLLSLWKVDDAATLEFMTRFYKRLKAGEGRADALAATQKEFRAGIPGKPEWKEPYYWAAWQLVGDWRPIQGL